MALPNSDRANRIIAMHKQGMSNQEIQAELKLGRSSVSYYLIKYGYRTKAKRGTLDAYRRLYGIHKAMIQRCTDENSIVYKYYGEKGVSVCVGWMEFDNFKEWAISNAYSDELTIDRIDSSGNYEPSNCRWVTQHEQILNQDRNKHREKEDRYIYQKGNRWLVNIIKGGGKNRKQLISQTCISKEEAIMCRDYFLEHGEKYPLY